MNNSIRLIINTDASKRKDSLYSSSKIQNCLKYTAHTLKDEAKKRRLNKQSFME